MSARDLDTFEQGILSNVEKHGCQVNCIFDPDGSEPSFCYSIGFADTVGQPEVIVFGLDQAVMNFMVNETLRQCRAGLALADGVRVSGLLGGFDCVVREVSPENLVIDYFNSAMWFHRYRTGRDMERAVQIVWPGAVDGLFPWDDGSAQIVIDSQPALYERDLDS
ncbi:MAG: DUF4262 domain-containing protein [Sphingomonas sp.]